MSEGGRKRQRFTRHTLRGEFTAAAASGHSPVVRAHPQRLVAMVIVDGPATGQSRRVSCYGALVVDMIEGNPGFALHRCSTSLGAERGELFAGIRSLSDDRHVVLASSHPFETFSDHCHILLDGLTFLDVVEADELVQPTGFTLLNVPEKSMGGLASAFDLPGSSDAGLAGRARYAGVRAQVAWLAYVSTSFGMREVRSLFAAYRAWQVLERAKPLPF